MSPTEGTLINLNGVDQHGVRRVRQGREAIEARKRREESKLKEYLALTEDVLSRVRSETHQILSCSFCNTEEE